MKKSEDPYLALLAYRTTPLQCGYSPSELLMSRKLRNTIPMLPPVLQPKVPDYTAVYARESSSQEQQATRFNQRHKAKSLCPLNIGQSVWITDCKCQGRVTSKEDHRSYWVLTSEGEELRRNRRFLIPYPLLEQENNGSGKKIPSNQFQKDQSKKDYAQHVITPSNSSRNTMSRGGRLSKPPVRYDPNWV